MEVRIPKGPSWPRRGVHLPGDARWRAAFRVHGRFVLPLWVLATMYGAMYSLTVRQQGPLWMVPVWAALLVGVLYVLFRWQLAGLVRTKAADRYAQGIVRVRLRRWVWLEAPGLGAWPRHEVHVEHSDGWYLVCGALRLPIEDGAELQMALA